jgi:ketosteroid isomerase-like protein
MSTDRSLQKAERLYAALDADDIPAVLGLCADDVTIEYPVNGSLPYGGVWQGREGVARFLDIHDEAEEILRFDVMRMIGEGDTVVVLGEFAGRAKPDGREWFTRFVHQLTFADARLLRWEAFFDTAAAVAARSAPPGG